MKSRGMFAPGKAGVLCRKSERMIQEGYDGYMYDNDFSNLGRQIQETVQNAVESMNYDRLNQTINRR